MLLDSEEFRSAVRLLSERDAHLSAVVTRYGMPEFWSRQPGFAALILFILEQQVSLASAAAAFQRLEDRVGPVTPAAIEQSTDAQLRADGFSRQKARYARALAHAVDSDAIDLRGLGDLSDHAVRTSLITLPGIGPWTADVYLLSCLRRPDIWPVGDRALQVGTAEILGMSAPPSPDHLEKLGERWRPHRSTAARLIWHGYLSNRKRS
jgi:DNA-3-methyladenine glycosylase II